MERKQQSMATMTRIVNFSAGPAVLPVEVLEEAQRDLMTLPGVGMSVLEISHRSTAFDEIIEGCEADLRALASIPDGLPRALPAGRRQPAVFDGADEPAAGRRLGGLRRHRRVVAEGGQGSQARRRREDRGDRPRRDKFSRVPKQSELTLDQGAAYVHYTTNNTIYGTEWHYVPDVGNVPLVADTSSDMFSRPIDVSKYALIYAGAQKNLAPAGLTLVIVRDDMLKRTPASLATMLQYRVQAENKSMYNTPPVFAIYIMRLVMKWLLKQGGLAAMDQQNTRKAEQALRRDRSHRLLSRPRDEGQPVAHERHVPAAERGSGKASS